MWNRCLQDSWMVPSPLPAPPAPPWACPCAWPPPPAAPAAAPAAAAPGPVTGPSSPSSPPQTPQSRTDTAILRPVPRERAMRSDATSAQSRVRMPKYRPVRAEGRCRSMGGEGEAGKRGLRRATASRSRWVPWAACGGCMQAGSAGLLGQTLLEGAHRTTGLYRGGGRRARGGGGRWSFGRRARRQRQCTHTAHVCWPHTPPARRLPAPRRHARRTRERGAGAHQRQQQQARARELQEQQRVSGKADAHRQAEDDHEPGVDLR